MPTSKHETRFILTGKDKTKAALGGVKAGLKGLSGSVSRLEKRLLTLAGIGGFGLLLKGLISTNAAFQTMKASLKTVTGSAEAASRAFDQIERFATSTPFEIDEVVQSFIKLKALGLDPSEEALRSYGNTASAMGKSLDQMIEAIADAATGEFERLKEFGIRASKQGDEVTFTFQGITTTIGNSAAEITGYLQSIGNNQFAGAMADQMGNLAPAFSNLSAALKGIQVDIGEAGLNDMVADLANSTTEFINSLDEDQIKQFTRAAINGVADLVDGLDQVVSYIDDNRTFAEIGAIGFLLFGKKGLAAILAGQALLEGMTKISAEIGESLIGGSGLNIETRLAKEEERLKDLQTFFDIESPEFFDEALKQQQEVVAEIRKTMSQMSVLPSDINPGNLGGSRPAGTFEEFAAAIRNQQVKQADPQLTEQTTILKEIAERLRDQTTVAVAG